MINPETWLRYQVSSYWGPTVLTWHIVDVAAVNEQMAVVRVTHGREDTGKRHARAHRPPYEPCTQPSLLATFQPLASCQHISEVINSGQTSSSVGIRRCLERNLNGNVKLKEYFIDIFIFFNRKASIKQILIPMHLPRSFKPRKAVT